MTASVPADVLVVGAGPGGLTAASVAAECGLSTIVLDDNLNAGGQIWRKGLASPRQSQNRAENRAKLLALKRFAASGATLLTSHRVFDGDTQNSTLYALHETAVGSSIVSLTYKSMILATGARERFLPFPGWTLPGVFGAGGLQALAQGGYSVRGKRVVVAGTGPLLLAVAAHLKCLGAKIVCIAEQASGGSLMRLAPALLTHPGKLLQGMQYRGALLRTPYRTHTWPVEAIAGHHNTLSSVRLTNGNRTWDEPCDLLACGFHLVPNNELAMLLGCEITNGFVKVDTQQQTTIPSVFSVGETTGIGGIDAAIVQGKIAALACAGKDPARFQRNAARSRSFGFSLGRAFALRAEVFSIAAPDTIVCRCEDVPLSRARAFSGWTEAKLQTRCGMGPCQGRICGPAIEALLGWKPSSVRPPIFPVPLAAFCSSQNPIETTKETA